MKISKTLLSGILAVGLAASASAQTYVRLEGSTAFRAGISQAIVDDMIASGSGSPTVVYWGSSFRGGNQAIISGTLAGIGWTVVETYWTGSASGVIDVGLDNVQSHAFPSLIGNVTDSSTNFLTNIPGTSNPLVVGGTNQSTATAPTSFDTAAPDAAMTDGYVGSIIKLLADVNVTGAFLSGSTAAQVQSAMTTANLTDCGSNTYAAGAKTVGIIPMQWVLGTGTSEHGGQVSEFATNITEQQAKQLLTNGWINFSELSGTSIDNGNFAIAIGRSEDSGSREVAIGEALDGSNFDIAPVQAEIVYTATNGGVSNTGATENVTQATNGYFTGGVSGTVQSIVKFPTNNPLNTETSLSWAGAGHSGYINGSDVATVLESYMPLLTGTNISKFFLGTSNTGFVAGSSTCTLVGYVGLSDAASAISKGCHALSYNGVPYTLANVQNGSYSMWGYEHMYYTNALAIQTSNLTKQACDSIADYTFRFDANCNKDDGDNGHDGASSSNAASGVLYGTMHVVRTAQEGGILAP